MKPYYQRGDVTLYHGDSAELSQPCDLILTDPPYGVDFVSNHRPEKWGRIEGDGTDDRPGVIVRLDKAVGNLKHNRHVYVFGGSLDLSSLKLGSIVELVWDKGMLGMGDLSLPWGPQHEIIRFGIYLPSKANRERGDGALSARLRRGSVLRSLRPNATRAKNHPTEKPLDILRQMIESSSMFGETVYDPFAGSGSTLVAAALEGRAAVGCEIEERYCETAAKRLDAEAF